MSLLSTLLEYKWVILFYSSVIFIVYLARKKLVKQGPLMYLYKTKFGLSLMDKTSKRFNKFIRIWSFIGIFISYFGLAIITYALLQTTYDLVINKPGAVGGSPVIPGLPIAGLGIKFPLVIGWISLFIIMIVHEFSHGIVARSYNLKVKSSGLAIFGPILGAFVELDDKKMAKQPHKVQHSILAAGPVSNIVLWLVCFMIMFGIVPTSLGLYTTVAGIFNPNVNVESSPLLNISFLNFGLAQAITQSSYEDGIKVSIIKDSKLPAYNSGMPDGTIITGINNYKITNFTTFTDALQDLKPGDSVNITDKSGKRYDLIAAKNPDNESMAFIGVTNFEPDLSPKYPSQAILLGIMLWFFELLRWTGFISINIGLINMFPIFITDGARMIKLNLEYFFKKRGDMIWRNINIAAVIIMLILVFLPLIRNLFNLFLSMIITPMV